MTREEAIKTLRELWRETYDPWYEETYDMAIEALKQVTGKLNNPDDSLLTADSEACKEQKSKLDLISRAEAIEDITETLDAIDHVPKWVFDKLTSATDILPSADRPKGKWIEMPYTPSHTKYMCSKCGKTIYTNSDYIKEHKFCFSCGADMRGEDE